jgi:hypothetical protein
MNEGHIIQAIAECNHGNVPFNLGEIRAFLYGKNWYPLRAVVNYAKDLAGEEELTTDRALVEFVYLGFNLRVKDVNFINAFPVQLNEPEIISEAHKLTKTLERLVS